MGFDREKRGLSQRKMEKPQVKKHTPLKSEGTTGSLSIRNVAGGVFLFFKGIGEWFKLFNSRNHMIPDVHGVYNIGSPDKRWKSLFVTDKSLHIGDTKANSVVLGVTGTGEDTKLTIKAKESTGDGIELGSDSISPRVIQSTAALRIEAKSNIAIRPDYNGNDTDESSNNIYIQRLIEESTENYETNISIKDSGEVTTESTITFKDLGIDAIKPSHGYGTFYVNKGSPRFKDDEGVVSDLNPKVRSGIETPSSISDKTPSIGDMYIQYTNTTGDGSAEQQSSGLGYYDGVAIIYIRDSDSRLLRLRPSGNYNGSTVWQEFLNTGPVYLVPKCQAVYYTESSSGTGSYNTNTLLVGSQKTVYGRAYYTDVTLPFSSGDTPDPRLKFAGQIASSPIYLTLNNDHGDTIQYTGSSTNIGLAGTAATQDSYIQLTWDNPSNSVTESDGQGGTAVVTSTASRTIYFKNHRIYGLKRDGDTWANALDNATASGGSTRTATLVGRYEDYADFREGQSEDYFTVNASAGDRIFFAIPNNADSPSNYWIGNTEQDFAGLSTATATYTNSSAYEITYNIWYGGVIGAPGSLNVTVW